MNDNDEKLKRFLYLVDRFMLKFEQEAKYLESAGDSRTHFARGAVYALKILKEKDLHTA